MIVSAIFLAALAMFALMNRHMRYSPEEIQALEKFTRIETYSEYFAIAEENERVAHEKVQPQ